MSKVYSLKTIQNLPVTLEKAWEFFSNPSNLSAITPAHMKFEIISKNQSEFMYPGQIIEYKVSPLPGFRIYWMTEITHVEEGKFFVDEQRFGPYNLWHHQHHFKPIEGGVEMIDIVHYKIPFWILGDVANKLFVEKQLKQIFQFRFDAVERIFGKWQ
jgi:ligand-binding SRPBCC domain-containing protein